MKKVLILGCNAITEFIVPRLTGLATISEIIIASRDKAECDELRKKYSGKGARITTARVDLDNEQGTKMMLSITNPDLIVNLAPAEISLKVMKLALEAGTDYIDGVLYDWENGNLLSKQFEHFAEFRSAGKMAVAGCAMRPALLAALVKNSMRDGFDVVNSADFYEINMTVEEPRDAVSVEEGKIIKKPAKSESIKLDKTFRNLRHDGKLFTEIAVLVTAETIALSYYSALGNVADQIGSKDLRAICNQMLHDELPHIVFQTYTLSHFGSRKYRKFFRRFVMECTTIAVYLMYGKLLKAGGYNYRKFHGDNVAYLKQSFKMVSIMRQSF